VSARFQPMPRVLAILGGLFAIVFIASGISPISRGTWVMENVLAVGLLLWLGLSARRFPLSRVSYTMIFVFLVLHEIGAHYTYSLVPYDEAGRAYLRFSVNETFGLERNHFDRLIHFVYGLLFFYPIREIFLRIVDVRGVWGYLLPLNLTMSTSMIYELIEWGAATLFGGDLGQAYLGTQGDVWDAHKDMAWATAGAAVAMAATFAINAWTQRDFAQELAESLRVKHPDPLGEEALARRLDGDDDGTSF
jgi:putative membrane protein